MDEFAESLRRGDDSNELIISWVGVVAWGHETVLFPGGGSADSPMSLSLSRRDLLVALPYRSYGMTGVKGAKWSTTCSRQSGC